MLEILNPGLMCTVQDAGRFGYQHLGVGPAGPMDWVSARLANLIVGNAPDEPVLEFSGAVGAFRFSQDALVCRVGGDLAGEGERLPTCRPVAVRANMSVKLEGQRTFRSYLAVAGGVVAPRVLGSTSISTVALLGTFEARGLAKGASLGVGTPSEWAKGWQRRLLDSDKPYPQWAVRPPVDGMGTGPCCVRVIRDTRGHCDDTAWRQFLGSPFRISTQSNRMGFRLEGPSLPPGREDIISHGVVTGTVQLPPGGQPIILMSDRQTTGGYPVLGHVASADLPLLAACQPETQVTFREISVKAAQQELTALNTALERRNHAIRATRPNHRWF